jgi:predicted secreted protein
VGRQQIGEDDDGRPVALAVGDELVLDLMQIGGTGYLWSLESVPAGLVLAADETTPGLLPGAAGRRRLTLRASGPGEGDLVARLARPWPGGETERRLSVPVRVA